MQNAPLLQPFQLKHLTLRNRIMTSSHEPAYPEEGMPKDRYRAYHVERAKGGIALTMTAGSAVVSRASRLANAVAPIPRMPQLKNSLRLSVPKSFISVEDDKFVNVKQRAAERGEAVLAS